MFSEKETANLIIETVRKRERAHSEDERLTIDQKRANEKKEIYQIIKKHDKDLI